eukprot:1414342-Rhodomonas_salina.5
MQFGLADRHGPVVPVLVLLAVVDWTLHVRPHQRRVVSLPLRLVVAQHRHAPAVHPACPRRLDELPQRVRVSQAPTHRRCFVQVLGHQHHHRLRLHQLLRQHRLLQRVTVAAAGRVDPVTFSGWPNHKRAEDGDALERRQRPLPELHSHVARLVQERMRAAGQRSHGNALRQVVPEALCVVEEGPDENAVVHGTGARSREPDALAQHRVQLQRAHRLLRHRAQERFCFFHRVRVDAVHLLLPRLQVEGRVGERLLDLRQHH